MNLVDRILNNLDEMDASRSKIGKTPFTKATGGKTTAPRDDFRSSPKSPDAGLTGRKARAEVDFPGSSFKGTDRMRARVSTTQRESEPIHKAFSPGQGSKPGIGKPKGPPERVKAEAPVKASLAKRWEARKKEKGLK